MNPTNLVEIIKAIAKEKTNQPPLTHHADRYVSQSSKIKNAPRTLAQRGRYKPQGKDLAEEEKDIKLGTTATGNVGTTVTFSPTNSSLVGLTSGPKPTIDTK